MQDSVRILSPISEWTVFQQRGEHADIELFGDAQISCDSNIPVIRVVDICTERTVIYERLALKNTAWKYSARLKTGMYRIETGVALKKADFNPSYLGYGDMIRSLFIGEVFIIAGQSNASGYGKGEICDIPQFGVSAYTDGWHIATHPVGQINNGDPNEDCLNCGHSAWLSLGKMILNGTQSPVGLVPAALNGSSIKMWDEGEQLFENMMGLAKTTRARHLIWYQGCTDTDCSDEYERKLDRFICNIEKRLGDIEIYIVQISGTTNTKKPDDGWRQVREAQRRVAVRHKTHLVVTYDLTRYSDDIHIGPTDNIVLSKRVYERFVDGKAAGGITIKRGEHMILEFTESLDGDSAKNIIALDAQGSTVKCDLEASGSTVIAKSRDIANIRYITLPFGRLFDGCTLKDTAGNCMPYFYIDIEKELKCHGTI